MRTLVGFGPRNRSLAYQALLMAESLILPVASDPSSALTRC